MSKSHKVEKLHKHGADFLIDGEDRGDIKTNQPNPMHEAREALANHPRCGAHCRTTGQPCENPSMKNGRCRMHGGKSTGRSATHGQRTKAAQIRNNQIRNLLMILVKNA
jgi:hypothetical protein